MRQPSGSEGEPTSCMFSRDAKLSAVGELPHCDIWGGAEYTYNRVGDRYLDQMEFSGHASRLSDYESFTELGISTFRFGIIWERHEQDPSWKWSEERMQWMRSAGVRPIVGLVHHGSGPIHTSLLDPQFAQKLAAYAGAVAKRYPWVDAYTPVNEPNTTARFSGMYGIWYPHHRSRRSYLQALLNQLKATVLSMNAIRRVRPDAKLVQTDDLGSISGTEPLRPIWEMQNLRRWLPFDLLCGKVDRVHRMFGYMRAEGISEAEILWFLDNPCPPDIIGVNYYLTSDRYLDHRVEMYPSRLRSAEGPFVDVETVRASPVGITGFGALLLEAWRRYEIPVAITEVHLGGPVHDQIRWLAEGRDGVKYARRNGANCIALTTWAMLGSFYWNELVTSENGHYEPGVFDVSSGRPLATELAGVVAQMAKRELPRHCALKQRGWWRDNSRILFPYGTDISDVAA
jgi:beta-glucosidase/6-phospho-beta-glucosidase/beta-galactosidase